MSLVSAPAARRLAFGIVLGQAAITVVAAAICWALWGPLVARSAAFGGGISTAASLAMWVFAFGSNRGDDPGRVARNFYMGEGAKLAVTIALFIIVLRYVEVNAGAMFGAYIATLFVYWIALANALPPLGGRPAARGR